MIERGEDVLGTVLEGRYRVEAVLGEAHADGTIFRGRDTTEGRTVVIRCPKIPQDLEGAELTAALEAFTVEAAELARVGEASTDVERLLAAGVARPEGRGEGNAEPPARVPYTIFEWLAGRSLERQLAERAVGGMSIGEALVILEPAARALAAAHALGTAHRDVRPANLWIAETSGRRSLKVSAFTLATRIGPGDGAFAPEYGAPEHFKRSYGALGPATDVYGLALCIVELVTGRPALQGTDPADLYLVTSDLAKRPTLRGRGAEASEAVEAALQRALVVDPRRRWPNARDFWEAIVAAVPERSPPPPSVRERRPSMRPSGAAPAAAPAADAPRSAPPGIVARVITAAAEAISTAKIPSVRPKAPTIPPEGAPEAKTAPEADAKPAEAPTALSVTPPPTKTPNLPPASASLEPASISKTPSLPPANVRTPTIPPPSGKTSSASAWPTGGRTPSAPPVNGQPSGAWAPRGPSASIPPVDDARLSESIRTEAARLDVLRASRPPPRISLPPAPRKRSATGWIAGAAATGLILAIALAKVAGDKQDATTGPAASAASDPTPARATPRPSSAFAVSSPSPADGAATMSTAANAAEGEGDGAAPDGGEDADAAALPLPAGMVRVPAGSFVMGSDHDGKGEKPPHTVDLSRAFYMDQTEVRADAYAACVAAGACVPNRVHVGETVEGTHGCNDDKERPTHPANCVDRLQAESYCAFVKKRLPTEAEWEYAARGTDGREYPWGNAVPTTCEMAILTGVAGECASRKGTWPVGTTLAGAGPFGALDLAGNVWEWVADGWDTYPADGSPVVDPIVPLASNGKGVLRGGSWDYAVTSAKAVYRLPFPVATGNVSIGFRCARDAAPPRAP